MTEHIAKVSDTGSEYCFILASTNEITFIGELDYSVDYTKSIGVVYAYDNLTGEKLYTIRPRNYLEPFFMEFGHTASVYENHIAIGVIDYDEVTAKAYVYRFDKLGIYDEEIYMVEPQEGRNLYEKDDANVGPNVVLTENYLYLADTGYGSELPDSQPYGAIFKFDRTTNNIVDTFRPEFKINDSIREFGHNLTLLDNVLVCSSTPAYSDGEYLSKESNVYLVDKDFGSYQVLDKPDIEDFGVIFDAYTTVSGHSYIAVTNTKYNVDEPKVYLYPIKDNISQPYIEIGYSNVKGISGIVGITLTDTGLCLQTSGDDEKNVEFYTYSGTNLWQYAVEETGDSYLPYWYYPIKYTNNFVFIVTLSNGRVKFIYPMTSSEIGDDSNVTIGFKYEYNYDVPEVIYENNVLTGNTFKTIYGNRQKLNKAVPFLQVIFGKNDI